MPFIIENATAPAVDGAAAPQVNHREVLSQLYNECTVGKNVEERKANATSFAKKVVASVGSVQNAFEQADLMTHLNKSFQDKKNAAVKEGLYLALSSLATLGPVALPYLIPTLPMLFEGLADKQKNVPKLARAALTAVVDQVNTDGALVKAVLPFMLPLLQSEKTAWQAKVGILQTISAFAKAFPIYVDKRLPELIPVVAQNIWDSHPDVARNASATLSAICYTVTNADLHKFIPVLVAAIKEPNNVAETVFQLAATTFVTAVEAPSLAIMAPILTRGLSEPARATLRQAAVIVDNMCKLVEVPAHAEQFLPKLLPPLNRVIATGADPELRDVATKAKATLVRVGGGKEDVVIVSEAQKAQNELEATVVVLNEMIQKMNGNLDLATMNVVATICNALDEVRDYSEASWAKITPFLVASDLQALVEVARAYFVDVNTKRGIKIIEKDESEGEELCNCEFSLAYGGMILLSNTTLRLTRGQRYGLCGPNGSGKTTLMRAIANGQVEGFPGADVLKTVFVEHNLQASDAEKSVIEFLLTDPEFKGKDQKKIKDTLSSVGFDDEKQGMAVGALSGGWKMKLELARAMLMEADILLLDEPTNHLDVRNIAWLTGYLQSLKNVTSIIVSHDSSFLDDVCSHIVHYEHRKLKTYKGNLSEFVKVKPEAKSYYDLISSPFTFKFPEPGFLEGIKSKDKAILTMKGVSFQYPNTPKPTVTGINVQCSLSSRVSVLGPNGAGKSTVIKVLTGETEPTSGDVWKHPTLSVAYVAQHAFHHIEQHLDKTPSEYIRWRYETGEDREVASKITRQLSPEEQAKLHQIIVIDGEKRRIEKIMGRRMTKRVFEYDIKWEGKSWDDNTWMSRNKLEDLGLEKYLKIYDDKESAREGLYQRPLTSANISKHLADVGLEDKFTSHSRIRGLSGGQKVKVVIGAAMWNNPHILVLDEPTNYLDRDSLGALASAIKDYGGGVIMVTHHTEFSQALCTETWNLEDGRLIVAGNHMPLVIEKIEQKETLEAIDAFGNTIKLKSTRTLSRKERLQKQKRREMKIKNGEPLDSDDEIDE